MSNPCLACGACCAKFRVSFYWRDADDETSGGVPLILTEDLSEMKRIMKNTGGTNPRCAALVGNIGESVRCVIYDKRPGVCRDFMPSYQFGVPETACDNARASHGLPPLKPEDWRFEAETFPPVRSA